MPAPRVVALVGPTGVGKTAVSLELASRLPVEIVCGDSRQIYRGLDVGTGKPTVAERRSAPHHLFDWLDVTDKASAGRYARAAAPFLEEIAGRGRIGLVVGGSGLYLRALASGLAPIPEIPPEVRAGVRGELDERGPESLHAELALEDSVTARRIAPRDAQRVSRALEVLRATGRPISSWQKEPRRSPMPPETRWLFLGLTANRERLYRGLDRRTRCFFAEGLLPEVANLIGKGIPPDSPGLSSLGYAQAVQLLQGKLSREEAIDRACRETRRYAKRQITWWRKEGPRLRVEWLEVGDGDSGDSLAARVSERARAEFAASP